MQDAVGCEEKQFTDSRDAIQAAAGKYPVKYSALVGDHGDELKALVVHDETTFKSLLSLLHFGEHHGDVLFIWLPS
jgi:hypothetical protein